MRKLLNLTGVKTLSKEELKNVNGSGWNQFYCKSRNSNRCYFMVGGVEYAEPGRCRNWRCEYFY